MDSLFKSKAGDNLIVGGYRLYVVVLLACFFFFFFFLNTVAELVRGAHGRWFHHDPGTGI